MKRFIQLTLASIVAVAGLSLAPVAVSQTSAINVFDAACGDGGSGGSAGGGVSPGNAPGAGGGAGSGAAGGNSSSTGSTSICGAKSDSAQDIIKNVINTILVVLGMVAVIMIILGGIRYTTSNGDAGAIKSAKDTILYAVVGLVVAIFAFAIVNFVVGRLS